MLNKEIQITPMLNNILKPLNNFYLDFYGLRPRNFTAVV